VNVQRFPGCNNSEDCMQEQDAVKNDKTCYRLYTAKNYRAVAVALAGQTAGGISAVLDFLFTFWGDAKK